MSLISMVTRPFINNGHLCPHSSGHSGQHRLRPLWAVTLVLVVTVGMLSSAVRTAHFTTRASAMRHRQSLDTLTEEMGQVKKAVDKVKQELKDAVDQSSKALYKEIIGAGAGWVKDSDVQLVAKVGAACAAYNSSAPNRLSLDATDSRLVAPVVVLAHARSHYLAKTMLTLYKHWSTEPYNAAKFPLFISIDGAHQPTLMLATSLKFAVEAQVIRVERDAFSTPCNPPWNAYCNLALHYKTLLQLFFECLAAPRLILLEEDLLVAPDFFNYFEATAPLLEQDKGLYCISAWNDQGQVGRASNRTAVYRTDVFPGLGWMLTRDVGLELYPTWPPGFWDDNHVRKAQIRKGRQCVFPEVPRTHTFGAIGASNGMYFNDHLETMVINTQDMDWRKMDLSYLTADKYAALMRQWLSAVTPITDILRDKKTTLKDYCNVKQPADSDQTDLYGTYKDNADFERLAKELPPMLFSTNNGVQAPRSSYNSTGHGAVIVRCRQRRLFLLSKPPGTSHRL